MRIAAIDVGSNSIHMVVAEARPDGHFLVLDRAKEMVRLGRRSLTTGHLTKTAMDHGIQALQTFISIAKRHGVTRFRAVATSAVRESSNGGEFIQRIYDEVGLRVRVIPGREEARLIYLGVSHVVDLRRGPVLLMDIGGGSVELVLVEHGAAVELHSVKLGVSRLTEEFLFSDPPRSREIAKLTAHVEEELAGPLKTARKRKVTRVVGTSGTLLALVSMAAYRLGVRPGREAQGLEVPAAAVAGLRRQLVKSDRIGRLAMRGMDPKRADLIVAGAVVTDRVLSIVKAKRIQACTWALREGLLLEYIRRHARGIEESARIADVRRRSVVRLARRFGAPFPHSEQVAKISLRLFDQLRARLGLRAETREWLEYAALLHDVGHLIDHEAHHQHSYYLVVNSELFGFRRDEIEAIGLIALHHHRKGMPKPEDSGGEPLLPDEWRQVKAASAILRLAEGLDRSHYAAVRDLRVIGRGPRLTIELATQNDAALELWEARRRTDLLGKLLGAEVAVRVARRKPASKARKNPAPKKRGRR
ncbi:MAG TPA: Ppx/GppA phosphatase family protein [Candidatus Polarisedimenticolaceae bacterium]|nr:Ppx/GppA phosphatase family protein [Candidatus Polarisedimenticolaceae bacterium]